jgi:hypothetical protein
MVISAQGALVRREIELESPEVYSLKFGDVVTCAEIVGRRARIIDPVEGWVSLFTSENEALFELTFPPDKRTQVRTMERRFDKLKQEQALRRSGDSSPVAAPTVQRSSDEGVGNLKSKIVFKSSSSSKDVSVPKLDMTNLKRPSTTSNEQPHDLLLEFDSPEQPTSRSTPEVPDTGFSLL